MSQQGGEPASAGLEKRRHGVWSPAGIALLTAVLDPLAGGILHGLNYGRLGLP
jgi:hypothetical protein